MTSSGPRPRPVDIGERREHLNLRALADLLVAAADDGPRNENEKGPKHLDQRQQR
jgi:hypothetical protein